MRSSISSEQIFGVRVFTLVYEITVLVETGTFLKDTEYLFVYKHMAMKTTRFNNNRHTRYLYCISHNVSDENLFKTGLCS